MIAHKPPSAPASPHPKRVPGKSLENGTRRVSQIPNERRQTRKRLASNTPGNRTSMNNWSCVAFARTFLGDGLEIIEKPGAGTIQKLHYLTGGDGSLFAMYVIDQNNESKRYYICTGHASTSLGTGLGSPNLITDAEGNVVQELIFDACCVKPGFCDPDETKPIVESIPGLREGNRRDPTTWQHYSSLADVMLELSIIF